MSELQKCEAVVLKKLNYGDTSKIVTLYTDNFGRITAIVKGGRSPKSKIGGIIDLLNHIQIVFYQKESREIQLISQADLVSHFSVLKEDLERLKHASAMAELLNNLTVENVSDERLFKGTVKMLNLMNDKNIDPKLFFIKYFLFFLDELGYELQAEGCGNCGNSLEKNGTVYYSYEKGFLCTNCKEEGLISFDFDEELFNLLSCLIKQQNDIKYERKNLDKIIYFLEKYLIYHVPEFKGIKSFHLY